MWDYQNEGQAREPHNLVPQAADHPAFMDLPEHQMHELQDRRNHEDSVDAENSDSMTGMADMAADNAIDSVQSA